MRIIVSPAGEYVDVTNGSTTEPYPHKLGTHSCGAEATLHEVSEDWRAIVCRSCNFRQLVPARVVFGEEIMARFFQNVSRHALLSGTDWNYLPALREALHCTLI